MGWSGALFADDSGSGPELTLTQAVDTALHHHPSLSAALQTSLAQEAKVGEVRSALLPQLSLSGNYQRATANFAPSAQFGTQLNSTVFGSPTNTSFDNYFSDLNLQQVIFDFGKIRADLDAAFKNLQASRWDLEAARQNVVLNAKVAYYGLLAARRVVVVNEETVRQFREHLNQAEGFFQAGTHPRFDVTKAEVDLTNAQLNLIKAKNSVEIARVTLLNAMGVSDRPIGAMEDVLDFPRNPVREADSLKEAMENRPELLSLSAKAEAGAAQVRSANRVYFPVLNGAADYTYRGQAFPLVWNWDMGVTLTFNLFSGLMTKNQVAEARANLALTQANREIERQNILLEVRQDYVNLVTAEEQVRTSEVVVRQAQENLDLANGRFTAGVGTSVERTDAQVSFTNAQTSLVQALYNYRTAEAQLYKAMGRRDE